MMYDTSSSVFYPAWGFLSRHNIKKMLLTNIGISQQNIAHFLNEF